MTKDIKGFEGRYRVSDTGVVYNIKGKPLRVHTNKRTGYVQCTLTSAAGPSLRYVHRLVAETFIPNPHEHKEVNHKDGDKQNNHADNLEWCTRSRNMKHAFEMGLCKGHPCAALSLDSDKAVQTFPSVKEAARFCGAPYSTYISEALNGKRPTAHGYRWAYL